MTTYTAALGTLADWQPMRGSFTTCAELTFGPTPLVEGDIIVLAPELPPRVGGGPPAAHLLDFRIVCERLDGAQKATLALAVCALNDTVTGSPTASDGGEFSAFRPDGERQLGVVPYGVAVPTNCWHMKFELPGKAFGLKVLRAPTFWAGEGQRLFAVFTYGAAPKARGSSPAGRSRGVEQPVGEAA